MNPNEGEPLENEHLQKLVKELTYKIGFLFSNDDQIKKILESIEEEGYQVDLVVASLSRIAAEEVEEPAEEIYPESPEDYQLNPFDYAFLQAIKVRP